MWATLKWLGPVWSIKKGVPTGTGEAPRAQGAHYLRHTSRPQGAVRHHITLAGRHVTASQGFLHARRAGGRQHGSAVMPERRRHLARHGAVVRTRCPHFNQHCCFIGRRKLQGSLREVAHASDEAHALTCQTDSHASIHFFRLGISPCSSASSASLLHDKGTSRRGVRQVGGWQVGIILQEPVQAPAGQQGCRQDAASRHEQLGAGFGTGKSHLKATPCAKMACWRTHTHTHTQSAAHRQASWQAARTAGHPAEQPPVAAHTACAASSTRQPASGRAQQAFKTSIG